MHIVFFSSSSNLGNDDDVDFGEEEDGDAPGDGQYGSLPRDSMDEASEEEISPVKLMKSSATTEKSSDSGFSRRSNPPSAAASERQSKRRKKTKSSEGSQIDDAMATFLKEKNKALIRKNKSRGFSGEKDDDIEIFMKSMALSIKKLPPIAQADVKFKIHGLVHDFEMKYMNAKQQPNVDENSCSDVDAIICMPDDTTEAPPYSPERDSSTTAIGDCVRIGACVSNIGTSSSRLPTAGTSRLQGQKCAEPRTSGPQTTSTTCRPTARDAFPSHASPYLTATASGAFQRHAPSIPVCVPLPVSLQQSMPLSTITQGPAVSTCSGSGLRTATGSQAIPKNNFNCPAGFGNQVQYLYPSGTPSLDFPNQNLCIDNKSNIVKNRVWNPSFH